MHTPRHKTFRQRKRIVLFACLVAIAGSSTAGAPSTWSNSLGMAFRPIPGGGGLLSVWETRVQDFTAFVDATGHEANERFFYYRDMSWRMDTNDWRSPGFAQTPDHPVAGASWADAMAFCDWLTLTERARGVISDVQRYRLPTEAEWSAAAAGTPNPYSLTNAANFHPVLNSDPFDITAPVGSFPPNPHGFYDMAGNVWEYCLDYATASQPFRVIRGGSWQNWHERYVGVHARGQCGEQVRITLYGFRIALVDDSPP